MPATNVTEIALAFDGAAASYDSDFGENPIAIWMRERVWQTCLDVFRPGGRILDLNAGTGIDAVFLAQNNFSVHAIDLSSKMLGGLSSKLASDDLRSRMTYEKLSLESLSDLRGKKFDGALSNFGGLNCLLDLSRFAQELANILEPGAPFVACVMGKFSLLETFGFLRHGKFKQSFRRASRGGTIASICGKKVEVYYYGSRQLVSSFAPFFEVEKIYGLGILVPPPWKSDWAIAHKTLFKVLARVDQVVSYLPVLRASGDHHVSLFRRRPHL